MHSEAVVLNKAGNGFITVTGNSGTVKSVSGDQLAITEGVKNVPYKDVTLTIPSNATVIRNHAKAQLSDLKTGDFVHVSQSSEGTFVIAEDASSRKTERGRFHGGPRGFGPGGRARPAPADPADRRAASGRSARLTRNPAPGRRSRRGRGRPPIPQREREWACAT